MPTYSYQCNNCSHILESFQKMSDAPLKECPNCGKDTLEKVLLSAPSFALKGSGWYKTDYSKDKAAPAVAAESAAKTSEASPSENKQEPNKI